MATQLFSMALYPRLHSHPVPYNVFVGYALSGILIAMQDSLLFLKP